MEVTERSGWNRPRAGYPPLSTGASYISAEMFDEKLEMPPKPSSKSHAWVKVMLTKSFSHQALLMSKLSGTYDTRGCIDRIPRASEDFENSELPP